MQVRDRVVEFRRVKASELRPSPKNWRRHPPAQADALRGLLAEVGFAGAALARLLPGGGLELIDGHLRAETLPEAEIPVLVLDVTEAEAAKLLASYDPLASMAEADAGALEALLRDVQTDSAAVQALLADLAEKAGAAPGLPEQGGGGDDFDATPAEGPTRTRAGELWAAGPHRLLVGDCTDAADVARLMAGEKVGLCFTSPPYAQQREYTLGAFDWDALMRGAFANLPTADDGQVLVNLGLVHRDGEWVPYWHDWIEWMRGRGWRRFGWYVWDQGSGLPGDWVGRFAPSHEWIFHFNRERLRPEKTVDCKQAGKVHRNEFLLKSSGKARPYTGVTQDTKIPDSVIRIYREQSRTDITKAHPAVYPVALPSAILEAWPADVYDPFLGSGTTLVAAHRLGRRLFGCEIEPRYADVCLRRAEAEGLACERILTN